MLRSGTNESAYLTDAFGIAVFDDVHDVPVLI
jgi:hypothetical protein